MSAAGGSRRALGLSFLHRYGAVAIRAVALVIMSRLMAPEDFGAFAIASSFTLMVAVIGDFGASAYLVRAEKLTAEVIGAAILVTCIAVWTLALGVFLAAGPLADFSRVPEAAPLIAILALSLVVQPVSSLISSLLQRRLAFGRIAVIGLSGELAIAVVGIGFAAAGHGAISLAYGGLAGALASAAVALLQLSHTGAPAPKMGPVRNVLKFGASISSVGALGLASEMFVNAAIVRSLGAISAGFYNRASTLTTTTSGLILQAARPVVLAVLSERRRVGQSLEDPYRLKASYVAAIAWPLAVGGIAFAPQIVGLALGDQFRDAALIYAILMTTLITAPVTALNFEFYVAADRVSHYFRQELVVQLAKVGLVVAGAMHSLEAAAAGVVLARLPAAVLTATQLWPACGMTAGKFFGALAPATGSTLAVVPGAVGLALWAQWYVVADWVVLVAALAVCVGPWLAAMMLMRHPLGDEMKRLTAAVARKLKRS